MDRRRPEPFYPPSRSRYASSISGEPFSTTVRQPDRRDWDQPGSQHRPRPSPLPPERSPTFQRSPRTQRPLWPPKAFAEDETTSLSRESEAHHLLQDLAKDDIPSRGTVDQEPLIMDVPELLNQHERRFVLSNPTLSNNGIPTPPTSEDERVRKVRRKPSKASIDDKEPVPDISQRTATPYAFTKPPQPQIPVSSSRRDSTRLSGRDYFEPTYKPDESAIDDSAYDNRPFNPKERHVTQKTLTESPRISPADFGPLAANAPPIRKLNLDARRNTDTQNTMPTLERLHIDRSRRPSPLVASSSLGEAWDAAPVPSASLHLPSAGPSPYSRSRESSYATSSRGPSPVRSTHSGATPPPRSPGRSTELPHGGSSYSSRIHSATNSRPTSPSPRTPTDASRMARPDLDWGALLAANAARRSQPPSRLSASFQTETLPNTALRAYPPEYAPQSTTLPYPEDSSLMGASISMPEEQQHAYYPPPKTSKTPKISLAVSDAHLIAPASPSLTESSRKTSNPLARPVLTRGYSATTSSGSEPRSAAADARSPRPFDLKRTESFATTSEARRELGALLKKGLPPCARPEPIAGYDDWYTISGSTNMDFSFCPDCIDHLFERTVFRSQFRRALPRSLKDKIRCAFGSPWIRLAWLLTLQQHRTDLGLLKDVAEIEETTDPCPGAVETAQVWYGLRDPDGLFVRDFHLCYGDVRKIERLLPTLAGIFVRLPSRTSQDKRTCAIRTDSNRFSTYLDGLVSTHEKAIVSRKGADPMPLIELVERKTRLRECTRDNMLIGALWHFIPEIPALTVCEDCFESVVEPEIKKGSSLAKKFNRAVQPTYAEGMGSSCQLYSRRMRKVFRRAVDDADAKYLARKSKERREMELWLQERYKEVMRRAKRISSEGHVSEDDQRRLTRDLEKISTEWKAQWE